MFLMLKAACGAEAGNMTSLVVVVKFTVVNAPTPVPQTICAMFLFYTCKTHAGLNDTGTVLKPWSFGNPFLFASGEKCKASCSLLEVKGSRLGDLNG